MRRILIVSHAAEMGGAEEVLLDVAGHFGPGRCHVALFTDGPLRRHLERAGIGVTLLQAGARMLDVRRASGVSEVLRSVPGLLRTAYRLARLARDYNVVYANSQKAAVVCLLVGRLARRPVVWHLHDILSAEHFGRLQRRVVVTLANVAARRVIVISEACRQSFIASGGHPGLPALVPNGVDHTLYGGVSDDEAQTLRRSLGIVEARLVGLFGRITPWKGQHVLVEALGSLPGTHALIVGSAMFGEDAYECHVRQLATRLGVAERVHWLGYRTDVAALMRAVDVVVHASVSPEPFGRVILQGLLARRPVLASSHGASAELLGAASPWLVAPGDPGALARAIDAVFATPPDRLVAAVEAHRGRATELFSLPRMMSGIERALDMPA